MLTLGIDVSKVKLDCALQRTDSTQYLNKRVDNSAAGIVALLDWLAQRKIACGDLCIVMEPTGVYHERAARALFDAGCRVWLVNPARVRSYASAMGVHSKTDAIDSEVLARYGASARAELWQPPPPAARKLTALLARREALCEDIRREENRFEKATIALDTPSAVLDSIKEGLAFLNKQRRRLDHEIDQHIDADPTLKHNDTLLQSIKGVGPRVAQRMNALMSAHRFSSAEALAAYIGLVPIERQSGSSVHGKARMSNPEKGTRAGPAHVRQLLYLPAVNAKRHNPHVKAIYERMLARGKSKMAGIGAAMRKLVHLCFGVIHSQRPYDLHYNTTAKT